jgi:hypothetical protein
VGGCSGRRWFNTCLRAIFPFFFFLALKPPPDSTYAGCMHPSSMTATEHPPSPQPLSKTGQAAARVTGTSKQRGSSNPAVTYRSAQKLPFLFGSWLLATRFCSPGCFLQTTCEPWGPGTLNVRGAWVMSDPLCSWRHGPLDPDKFFKVCPANV